jgi:hypothetical protein
MVPEVYRSQLHFLCAHSKCASRRGRAERSIVLLLCGTALLGGATGCSSVSLGGSNSSPKADTHITVAITPANSILSVGQQEQLAVAVTGTPTLQVNWSVNGVPGGNATVGTISSSDLYTAPVAPPLDGSVTIRAASVVDSSAVATATITVIGSMTISPETVSVPLNGVQSFTATENGSSNPAVQWQVNGVVGGDAQMGTISAGGLYTAPTAVPASPVTVSAVDPTNKMISASAMVTIFDPAVVQAHNNWLAGLPNAARIYGCTSVAVLQQSTQTVDDAIADFAQTANEGSCLALWPISTDPTVLRYSFAWGGVADGKDIFYLSDIDQLRIWNGAEVDSTASESESFKKSVGGNQ